MNDMNSKKSPSSSWTAFGKFSTVIAILQFTFSLNKKEANITYSFKFMEYHKSPEKTSHSGVSDYYSNKIDILDFEIDKNEYSRMKKRAHRVNL
jgi:hypothetical protein